MRLRSRPVVTFLVAMPGATDEQLAAGASAAREAFDIWPDVYPIEAQRARAVKVAWRRGEGPEPSAEEHRLALVFSFVWLAAGAATVDAGAADSDDFRFEVCLLQ